MSDGISAPFIRYPIGTSLMMAGILFVGLVAYPLLPVAPLPQVDFPTIQITATLPPALKPWPPRWLSRWSGSSRRSRASPR
jgi:HAE1 family hydrophobic/amphiphilic exporter-1